MSEISSPVQDLKAISMFPNCSEELASIDTVHEDMINEKTISQSKPEKKQKGILQFFQF
jgi:hypothetical protein